LGLGPSSNNLLFNPLTFFLVYKNDMVRNSRTVHVASLDSKVLSDQENEGDMIEVVGLALLTQ
jgi:hypothetical protein